MLVFLAGFLVSYTPPETMLVNETVLGYNTDSFFVLQQKRHHPPTYYEFSDTTKFLRKCIYNGDIISENLVRVRAANFDFDLDSMLFRDESVISKSIFENMKEHAAQPVYKTFNRPDFRLQEDGIYSIFDGKSDCVFGIESILKIIGIPLKINELIISDVAGIGPNYFVTIATTGSFSSLDQIEFIIPIES